MAKIIHCADMHLRPDLPLCRLDPDWMKTQADVLSFIRQMAAKTNSIITNGGDVFDSARTSPSVLHLFLNVFLDGGEEQWVIAGNHSLIYHNQENLMESSIGALKLVRNNIHYLECDDTSENGIFEHTALIPQVPDVRLVHSLIFPTEEEIPYGARAHSAGYLLDKYPEKYILTGDQHHFFIHERDGRFVINPGTPIIQSADLIDYAPSIVYIDTDTGKIERILVPNDPTMITKDHIESQKDRDARIEEFVATVKKHGQLSLSFEENLHKAVTLNPIEDGVLAIIEEIEEENK